MGTHVIGAVCGGDVNIARAAVELHVAGGFNVTGRGIVGDGVRAHDVVTEVDLHVSPQRVDVPFAFQLIETGVDGLAFAGAEGKFAARLGLDLGGFGRVSAFRARLADN